MEYFQLVSCLPLCNTGLQLPTITKTKTKTETEAEKSTFKYAHQNITHRTFACQMQGVLGPPIVYYYIQVTKQMLMDQPTETLVRISQLL